MPGVRLFGADAAGNKLNIALIGSWGRGQAHFGPISSENVVAICDINEEHMVGAAEKFPKAKKYVDWRKCLEQKDINAVVICTTDFTHAFVANWALNRGYHVYCEKPLGNTVEEVRTVRANYLKNKNKLATQVGTQRHELENFNRVQELIRDGAIGQVTDAYAWGNRQIRRPGYLPAAGTPPANLHYDLWLGPIATDHPYNPDYFSGGPGANCLQWNMYWDFGSGQIGDMGSHTMDLVWDAVEAGLPTTAEGKGQEFNPEVTPVELETHFDFPANSWRGPMRISWYQGGYMPRTPKEYVDLNKIDHGAMFKGTKGFLICNFDSRLILPIGKDTDMTYYTPRPKDKVLPAIGNFQKEWINACKGNLKTSCDFEYGGNCIEMMLLGLVAYRVGKKLEYDGATGKVTNSPEANELLSKKYRQGWTLNG
jgi:predicted dehydrogenase